MKYFLLLLMLAGCSSKDKVEIVHHKEIYQMDREEVIHAINDCRSNGLRSVINRTRIRTDSDSIPIIINVTCAPRGDL
jgi:uncharacterized protein YcfL